MATLSSDITPAKPRMSEGTYVVLVLGTIGAILAGISYYGTKPARAAGDPWDPVAIDRRRAHERRWKRREARSMR